MHLPRTSMTFNGCYNVRSVRLRRGIPYRFRTAHIDFGLGKRLIDRGNGYLRTVAGALHRWNTQAIRCSSGGAQSLLTHGTALFRFLLGMLPDTTGVSLHVLVAGTINPLRCHRLLLRTGQTLSLRTATKDGQVIEQLRLLILLCAFLSDMLLIFGTFVLSHDPTP